MRNRRELYRIRIENLDWNNRIIFVPDNGAFHLHFAEHCPRLSGFRQ